MVFEESRSVLDLRSFGVVPFADAVEDAVLEEDVGDAIASGCWIDDPASAQKRTVVQRSLGTQLTLPDDQRYRTVYETNIALRNRLYGN